MPKMPCLDCGIPTQRSRCESCQAIVNLMKPPRIRGAAHDKNYNYAWRKVRVEILERDRWLCHYCGKQLEGSDATVDHVLPIAKYGATLDKTLLVAACRSCNSRKKDRV